MLASRLPGRLDRRALLLGQGGERGPDGGGELLPHPGNAEELGRMQCARRGRDGRGVRAEVDVRGAEDRQIDPQHPLGDVCEGQVADVRDVVRQFHHPVQGQRVDDHAAVGEGHGLRIAGGTRGVDDRECVVGARGPPGRVELRLVVGLSSGRVQGGIRRAVTGALRLHDEERLQRDGRVIEEGLPELALPGALDDSQPGAAVPGDVGDLPGCGGAVDSDRYRPEVGEGQVTEPVFGAVAHHHEDLLPSCDAVGGVSGGEHRGLAAHLTPGQGRPSVAVVRAAPREGGQVPVVLGVTRQQGRQGQPVGLGGDSQDRGHGRLLSPSAGPHGPAPEGIDALRWCRRLSHHR